MPAYVAAFEHAFVFSHPGELLFGTGLLYYSRLFERQVRLHSAPCCLQSWPAWTQPVRRRGFGRGRASSTGSIRLVPALSPAVADWNRIKRLKVELLVRQPAVQPLLHYSDRARPFAQTFSLPGHSSPADGLQKVRRLRGGHRGGVIPAGVGGVRGPAGRAAVRPLQPHLRQLCDLRTDGAAAAEVHAVRPAAFGQGATGSLFCAGFHVPADAIALASVKHAQAMTLQHALPFSLHLARKLPSGSK